MNNSTTLRIFNPSHDEALAAHRAQYCPTRAARVLGAALANLPEWWSHEGDRCLPLPESMNLSEVVRPDWTKVARIDPWGWDMHIVQLLRRLGAPERLLPSSEQLEDIRELSSRKTNVRLLQLLNAQPEAKGILKVESRWCATLEAVEAALEVYPDAMLKLPWSSSGRGVFPVRGGVEALPRARVLKALREQGGIEVQPLLDGVADAALEFEINAEGQVFFLGCSLFSTTETGAYTGHFVDTPARLQERFCRLWQSASTEISLSADDTRVAFSLLLQRLTAAFESFFSGRYVGPFGVDVLFTPAGIHPGVEINLRRTMGHVALAIAERLSPEKLPATFSVATGKMKLKTANVSTETQ